ncbi:MAG: radical SAM family heme chaperone HemW [Pseudomonadota bacterium]|nr:radical SAM family heme chaperone HemW [Pseudomonadota bacterium]
MTNTTITIPLGLYCHLPWCIQKCPYCDFNSYQKKSQDSISVYTDSLCVDLQSSSKYVSDRSLQSIFFGGGTPSLFPPSSFGQIIECIHQYYALDKTCEITIEINPHTYALGWLSDYYSLGINRASIGAQSFSASLLQKIGRTHTPHAIGHTFSTLRRSGFENINIDIMYALPDQTLAQALSDLQQAIALQPEHISWYELTIEPNTSFAKNTPDLPRDDTVYTMFVEGQKLLQQSGYIQYEISAYSKSSAKQCKHNLNYWQYGDYLGCGAGSHSKLTTNKPFSIQRFQKHKSPKAYQLAPYAECYNKKISVKERIFEYMLNRLRLVQPVSINHLISTTSIAFSELKPSLIEGKNRGFLYYDDKHISLTPHGRRFLNDAQAIFI